MDEEFDGDYYPQEVWEQIFRYVSSVRDLKTLSLVSKSFYQLIGKSPELMKNFVLKFSAKPKDGRLIRKSCRKYQILKIHERDFRAFSVLSMLNNKPIKWIKLQHTAIRRDCVGRFFEVFQNTLEYVELGTTKFNKVPPDALGLYPKVSAEEQKTIQKLSLPKLKHLKYIFGDYNLCYFMPDTLESLRVRYEDGLHCTTQMLTEFLAGQTHLKKLVLEYHGRFNILFPNQDIETKPEFKFKLEHLSIKNNNFLVFPKTLLNDIAISQRAHLKILRLINIDLDGKDLVNLLNSVERLEELELLSTKTIRLSYGSKINCPTVKYLKITHPRGKNMWNLIRGFPNLKELHLGFGVDSLNLRNISRNNPKIQKLAISKYRDEQFKNVTFRQLKSIEIKSLFLKTDNFQCLELLRNHRQLREIKLNFKTPLLLNELREVLKSRNLKVLEIRNGSELMKVGSQRYQADLFKNLEILKIYNCADMSEKIRKQITLHPGLKSYFVKHKKKRELSRFSTEFDASDVYGFKIMDRGSQISGFNFFGDELNRDSDYEDSSDSEDGEEPDSVEDDTDFDYSTLEFPFNIQLDGEFDHFNPFSIGHEVDRRILRILHGWGSNDSLEEDIEDDFFDQDDFEFDEDEEFDDEDEFDGMPFEIDDIYDFQLHQHMYGWGDSDSDESLVDIDHFVNILNNLNED